MSNIFELFRKIESENESNLPVTHIIAGLGNPGVKYSFTRHNIGFLALDYISQKYGFSINRSKFRALVADKVTANTRCLYMLPQTFMNNSGEAIAEAASFYKIPPENILVIFDDISLDVGRIRIRRKGSDGGHNGIKSIIYHLKSDNFPRIKIGVGSPTHPDYDLVDWVLGSFADDEKKQLLEVFDYVKSASELIVGGEIEKAANLYNGKI